MIEKSKAEGPYVSGTRLLRWMAEKKPWNVRNAPQRIRWSKGESVNTVRTCIRIIFWNASQWDFLVFLFTKPFYHSVSCVLWGTCSKTRVMFLASVWEPRASEELRELGAWSKREACWLSGLESVAQTRMKGRVGEEVRSAWMLVAPQQWVLQPGHLPWLWRNGKGKATSPTQTSGYMCPFPN